MYELWIMHGVLRGFDGRKPVVANYRNGISDNCPCRIAGISIRTNRSALIVIEARRDNRGNGDSKIPIISETKPQLVAGSHSDMRSRNCDCYKYTGLWQCNGTMIEYNGTRRSTNARLKRYSHTSMLIRGFIALRRIDEKARLTREITVSRFLTEITFWSRSRRIQHNLPIPENRRNKNSDL